MFSFNSEAKKTKPKQQIKNFKGLKALYIPCKLIYQNIWVYYAPIKNLKACLSYIVLKNKSESQIKCNFKSTVLYG